MAHWRVKATLFLTYLIFAMLLNSVGTVILQSINIHGVSKPTASTLEGFKDLSVALVSFLVASFLPRYGYRNAMMTALAMVALAAVGMRLVDSFTMTRLMFLVTGISFALVKISTYSTIGLITRDKFEHAALMNSIEGVFMIGVLLGYWLFGWFIDRAGADLPRWLDVYWVLVGLCVAAIALLATTPYHQPKDEARSQPLRQDFLAMLKLATVPMVYVFVIAAFLYVLIEQGIGTWLPTFNNQILKLPSAMSVQAASVFAGSLAIGRLSAGVVLRRVHWYPVLSICVLMMAVLVLVSMPLTHGVVARPDINWLNAPVAAYIFPLIGLFMAPIYPAINSVMLSALPKARHAAMTGLIVIFSALGGTTGSIITALVFDAFDGRTAYYLSLIPMAIILVALFGFKRAGERFAAQQPVG